MNPRECAAAIAYLNELWPRQPLGSRAAETWARKLQPFEAEAVKAVLDQLVEVEDWRPSLAKVLAPLKGKRGASDTSGDALAALKGAILLQGMRQAIAGSPPRTQRAVRIIGWDTFRSLSWEGNAAQWSEKRWRTAYDEAGQAIEDETALEAAGHRLALPGGASPIAKALATSTAPKGTGTGAPPIEVPAWVDRVAPARPSTPADPDAHPDPLVERCYQNAIRQGRETSREDIARELGRYR